MSKTNHERGDKEEKFREESHKKRRSHIDILNSYRTGDYEEEDFYYEQREKFRDSKKGKY